MSEFVGRTGSLRVYSYPEPRFTGSVGPFARNAAAGPCKTIPILATGTPIPWGIIESVGDVCGPVGLGVADVPITPVSTGIIRIIGVVTVTDVLGGPTDVLVQVYYNGTLSPFPLAENTTINTDETESIPVLTEIFLPPPLGATSLIRIVVSATDNVLGLVTASSTIDIQELPAATG